MNDQAATISLLREAIASIGGVRLRWFFEEMVP
jgi:hypothetical protein